jgi:hypothetical protein
LCYGRIEQIFQIISEAFLKHALKEKPAGCVSNAGCRGETGQNGLQNGLLALPPPLT